MFDNVFAFVGDVFCIFLGSLNRRLAIFCLSQISNLDEAVIFVFTYLILILSKHKTTILWVPFLVFYVFLAMRFPFFWAASSPDACWL